MTSRFRQIMSGIYLAIAVIALIGTWHQNLAYFGSSSASGADGQNSLTQFWLDTLVNPASTSITIDILFLGLAVVFWMVTEARRLQIRFVWLYVVFGLLIAISVTVPLFLFARERKLLALDIDTPASNPFTAFDIAALAVLSGGLLGFTAWTLFR